MPGKTTVGKWEVTVSGNPISGANDVKLRLKSSKGRNQYAAPIGLIIECKAGRGSARMIWDEHMVRNVPIEVMLDGSRNAAATNGWQPIRDFQEWVMEGDVKPMIRALIAHRKMTVDAVSYETTRPDDDSEGNIHAVWDLTGTEFAMRPFFTLCGS